MTTDSNETPQERPHRRRYDEAFKRSIVEQTRAPGVSVARIAREHGINANQLFKWRREFLLAKPATPVPNRPAQPPVSLVPVTVVSEQLTPTSAPAAATGKGQIEITLAGCEVRIRGAVDAATLHVVLSSLRR